MVVFGVILYFMADLTVTASRFFIFLLFQFTTTICITSLYRMFASLSPAIDDAVRFSGIALSKSLSFLPAQLYVTNPTASDLLVIYTGYVIPKPQLIGDYIWFGW